MEDDKIIKGINFKNLFAAMDVIKLPEESYDYNVEDDGMLSYTQIARRNLTAKELEIVSESLENSSHSINTIDMSEAIEDMRRLVRTGLAIPEDYLRAWDTVAEPKAEPEKPSVPHRKPTERRIELE